jgi:hypothetical protein
MAPATRSAHASAMAKAHLGAATSICSNRLSAGACRISLAISAKGEQLSLYAPLDRPLGNTDAKHKFIHEVKEHEKTNIPYKISHGDSSLRKWSVAGSRN